MFLFDAATSVPTWISAFGAVLTGFAALLALGLVGLNESRKLRSQHRQDERRRLQALIGRYHGPLLEAAIDWDRRMQQLLTSKPADVARYGNEAAGLTEMEWFMDDRTNYDTDDWVYGKFCNPDEYMFRSFVFRFLVLCSLARKFEAEAFYHDEQVARYKDFQFLKYAKAFLWAPTHGDCTQMRSRVRTTFPTMSFGRFSTSAIARMKARTATRCRPSTSLTCPTSYVASAASTRSDFAASAPSAR